MRVEKGKFVTSEHHTYAYQYRCSVLRCHFKFDIVGARAVQNVVFYFYTTDETSLVILNEFYEMVSARIDQQIENVITR